ncbi:iron chelate uptake ABC transporter family permease subunit [Acetobacterium paludosum]|uniref:Iron chelate uptake ABC transporter family permease subunit n=1 Tax=Acetobacterium paludosum TaxID=52693 RepID=A0A923HT20_9FIRM|nr:iron ABC transporter permease [Acetobacterium paludosum]MBC3888134.1 iron chelate uptake ABC transporter family permease subunit [Acetobacterium paludosum]
MSPKKKTIVTIILIILPIIFFFGTICIGRYYVSLKDVCLCLWQGVTGYSSGLSTETIAVVLQIRLPRAFLGAMVGAALAASGAAFQGLFRNPLVSSGILGVSSGAGFGAALAIVLFNNIFLTPVFAFVFGVIAVILSYFAGRIDNTSPTITLVLGGTIIQSIFAALISLLKYVADSATELPAITFWLMGSLASTKTSDVLLAFVPMVIGMMGLLLMRYRLNVLSMGDREAKTLGIHVNANKAFIIISATLATAGAVCVSGVVGWIGLIIPHVARMLVGNDNKWVVPASMSVGACFVILCDTICRTLTGGEIPLGIITALIGGPFFIYLLKKTKGRNW